MHWYRIALAALAWLVLLIVVPPAVDGIACQLARTDAAESWAQVRENLARSGRFLLATPARAATAQQAAVPETAPLTLQDFAGRWWHHGMSLTINPDGTATMDWRRGGAGVEPGAATARVGRVEGRTLYGTVLTASYQDLIVRGPFELTEYDYGIGELSDARGLGARAIGAPDDQFAVVTICGPRYTDAPSWFRRIRPCGA